MLDNFYLASTELFVRPAWQDGRTIISKLMAADATNYPAGFFPKGLLVCEVSSGVVDPYINNAYATLSTCETIWTDGTNGTVELVTDTPAGVYSEKITIAAAASAGDVVAYLDVTSVDISDGEFLMAWVKSSIALDAADIKILTDDTSSCVSPDITCEVPALNADEWTFICVAVSSGAAATISVGIEADVDKGAMDFWIADVRTADVQAGSAAVGMLAENVVFDPNKRAEYGDYDGTGNFQARVATSGEVRYSEVIGYDSDALTDLGGVLRENSTVLKY